VGPVSFEAGRGEIIFIIGGNGSGKTTLSKLLTGLYRPDKGEVLINDKITPPEVLGEYFSVVFSPAYYFERIYNVDLAGRENEIQEYLQILRLENKVSVKDGKFSTINLSGGQRKRLALLLCYLEDAPVYLFDEWAADQDPEYRKFFYRILLPRMRDKGKIVIAVTHDDHYFDVADKVLKMDHGKMEFFTGSNSYQPVFTDSKI
jgi:putative pyoverdin transport system ATP-binding/permease protein